VKEEEGVENVEDRHERALRRDAFLREGKSRKLERATRFVGRGRMQGGKELEARASAPGVFRAVPQVIPMKPSLSPSARR
jgi:hypothetical protein